MATLWNNYRYLILRRFTQVGLLVLYFGANAWGWTVLMGNLSSSKVLGVIPLSDPYAALQPPHFQMGLHPSPEKRSLT